MGASHINWLRRREVNAHHLKHEENHFVKVSGAALKQVAKEIAIIVLGLLIEANKLPGLEVLQVAHRKQLALVLEFLCRFSTFVLCGDGREETILTATATA